MGGVPCGLAIGSARSALPCSRAFVSYRRRLWGQILEFPSKWRLSPELVDIAAT
jgi:hypothetical protein